MSAVEVAAWNTDWIARLVWAAVRSPTRDTMQVVVVQTGIFVRGDDKLFRHWRDGCFRLHDEAELAASIDRGLAALAEGCDESERALRLYEMLTAGFDGVTGDASEAIRQARNKEPPLRSLGRKGKRRGGQEGG
jgi:hypothetical protein